MSHSVAPPSCAATKKLIRSEALPPLLCSLFCFAVKTTLFFFFLSLQEYTDDSLALLFHQRKKERESPHWILQAPSYLMRQCFDHQGFQSAAGVGCEHSLLTCLFSRGSRRRNLLNKRTATRKRHSSEQYFKECTVDSQADRRKKHRHKIAAGKEARRRERLRENQPCRRGGIASAVHAAL